MFLYNSLTKHVDAFEPLKPPAVSLYTCGPTVYDYPHIGNCRKYVMDDVLKRTLTLFGYQVKHVQNVTDVGHLVSDADEGEDKMEKGAAREGKTVWDIAKFYEDEFYRDMDSLAIIRPGIICRATEHINEQVSLISKLVEKVYAYDTPEAVYLDVTKFDRYEALSGQRLEEKEVASRDTVEKGTYKKHAADFALWFKRTGKFANHVMHWESPWGDGFPGWHIECSAMSMKYLGETIDIHTGGIDHISIHHPNEIAQSEGATGTQFVRFWMHHAFLMVEGEKMSKSTGSYYRLSDVIDRGFSPMDLRYVYLLTHYRKTLNFTWEGLHAAREARVKISNYVVKYRAADHGEKRTTLSPEKLDTATKFRNKFCDALSDDLNTPQAVAVVWEVLKSTIPSEDKYDLIVSFDEVLGLGLANSKQYNKIPPEIQELVDQREKLRKEKKWEEADRIRGELGKKGYDVIDNPEGSRALKIGH